MRMLADVLICLGAAFFSVSLVCSLWLAWAIWHAPPEPWRVRR